MAKIYAALLRCAKITRTSIEKCLDFRFYFPQSAFLLRHRCRFFKRLLTTRSGKGRRSIRRIFRWRTAFADHKSSSHKLRTSSPLSQQRTGPGAFDNISDQTSLRPAIAGAFLSAPAKQQWAQPVIIDQTKSCKADII